MLPKACSQPNSSEIGPEMAEFELREQRRRDVGRAPETDARLSAGARGLWEAKKSVLGVCIGREAPPAVVRGLYLRVFVFFHRRADPRFGGIWVPLQRWAASLWTSFGRDGSRPLVASVLSGLHGAEAPRVALRRATHGWRAFLGAGAPVAYGRWPASRLGGSRSVESPPYGSLQICPSTLRGVACSAS